MATITSSIDEKSTVDLMGDLEEPALQLPKDQLSEHGQLLAEGMQIQPSIPTPKKRAYFWLKAKPGDEAFRTKSMNSDRKMNMDLLRRVGYEVTIFKTNRAFFDHIEKDPSMIDLFVVSGHGHPYLLEDLKIRGEDIISTDLDLTEDERENGFKKLQPLLNKDSFVVFDACLTGNKSVKANLAMVASKILPQSRVFASQHVTTYEPGYMFKEGEKGEAVIDTIMFGHSEGNNPMKPVIPTIYQDGVETTDQDAVPIPPELIAKKPSRYKPYMIGAAVVISTIGAIGFGMWYFSNAPEATIGQNSTLGCF